MHSVEGEEHSLFVLPSRVERRHLWPDAIRENEVGHAIMEAGRLGYTCCSPYCSDRDENLIDSFNRMHFSYEEPKSLALKCGHDRIMGIGAFMRAKRCLALSGLEIDIMLLRQYIITHRDWPIVCQALPTWEVKSRVARLETRGKICLACYRQSTECFLQFQTHITGVSENDMIAVRMIHRLP